MMSASIKQPNVREACCLLPWLLVWSLITPTGQAQGQICPFTEEEAVADTLDPKGYYPLDVGIVREYVSRSDAFLLSLRREKVIADTLIEGDLFHKLKVIWFDAEHTTAITDADTSYSYRGVLDGVLFTWTPEEGKKESEIQFNQDFNTCYTHVEWPDGIVVEGAYDTTFTCQPGESTTLAASKQFNFIVPQAGASLEYGYGLGLVRSGAEPNMNTTLAYSLINEQECGTPLDSLFNIRVSAEQPYLPEEPSQLEAYPNPSAALIHFALVLVRPGRATVQIYDVQGQLIATPVEGVFLSAGAHSVSWRAESVASGVYLARLLVEGHPRARKSLIITR